MPDKKVVTRFAPSPTGFLHVGGVRTALYAYLWARKNKGTFILRIEDTDKAREVQGSIQHIIDSLKWVGIEWDQGPDIGGPHASYLQSERLELYKKYAQILIDKGHAYPDPYTSEELEAFRKKADEEKRPFLYRNHRPENFGVWDGTKALRFKTPEIKGYKWNDVARGELSAGPEALDDFILIKSDGYPTYNFAHIIDDLDMEVTHIMRADEFIASTPKFLSLYDALGITPPIIVSMPPILGESGNKKLGKRDGAKDILDYKKDGYLPEAMFNFLALIGWNPGDGDNREVMTKQEIMDVFDLSHIQTAGGKFNEEKLDWFNKEHIRKMSHDDFIKVVRDFFVPNIFASKEKKFQSRDLFIKYLISFKDRITKLSDLNDIMLEVKILSPKIISDTAIFNGPEFNLENYSNALLASSTIPASFQEVESIYDYLVPNQDPIVPPPEILVPKDLVGNNNVVFDYLTEMKNIIEHANWQDLLIENSEANPLWAYSTLKGRGSTLAPLRIVLSGLPKSKNVFEIMDSIGLEATLRRIKNTIEEYKSGVKNVNVSTTENKSQVHSLYY